jgi:hypothetical protein
MQVMQHYLIHPNNSVVRRDIFDRIGGFVNRLSWLEDYNLMMRIANTSRRTLYRPDVVVGYRFAQGDSVSFTYNEPEKHLQGIFSTQHVRATCANRKVRRCARAREAWALREISWLLAKEGNNGEALIFAWQGLCTYPTLGAGVEVAKVLGRCLTSPLWRPQASPTVSPLSSKRGME